MTKGVAIGVRGSHTSRCSHCSLRLGYLVGLGSLQTALLVLGGAGWGWQGWEQHTGQETLRHVTADRGG